MSDKPDSPEEQEEEPREKGSITYFVRDELLLDSDLLEAQALLSLGSLPKEKLTDAESVVQFLEEVRRRKESGRG